MKIIRHTARDMRQALRGVREQLGEDAVILSSRRTGEGVEITAAVDFDASTLEAGGFANSPAAPLPVLDAPVAAGPRALTAAPHLALPVAPRPAATAATRSAPTATPLHSPTAASRFAPTATPPHSLNASADSVPTVAPFHTPTAAPRSAPTATPLHSPTASPDSVPTVAPLHSPTAAPRSAPTATPPHSLTASADSVPTVGPFHASTAASRAAPSGAPIPGPVAAPRPAATAAPSASAVATTAASAASAVRAALSSTVLALTMRRPGKSNTAAAPPIAPPVVEDAAPAPSYNAGAAVERLPSYNPTADDAAWISEAAREAVAEHTAAPLAPVLAPAEIEIDETAAEWFRDPVEEIREATLSPLASNEVKATFAEFKAPAAPTPAATEAMGNELKTLRRMLETQLAHLAWNDLTRRAPIHTEILRELTEIGITQELAEHLVRQLPEDAELTFARRFTIAGLSQYLKVTGDRWLDEGGRVAFVGATGVGKTTTLAKIAVRWVLRHGPRDIALVAADSMRIGAQDQLQSLAQLLGVPVYTPEKFEALPTLLTRLNERLILIDTPGSSVRDPQLANRLAVLSNSASKLETALVLAASTQAGAIEEAVRHFAPANPSCCVLTKLDEAASIGGVLSILIRARLPVSYMSEGQRVPEDLRPARALELVSAAVRLAKASGAAADEDLLRRRFGKTAHGIS